MITAEQLRGDFPILAREVRNGKPLIYLDSAATTQKPTAVIEAVDAFYRTTNGAVQRGAHLLAEESTAAFEDARATVARFVGAEPGEIVWTENATYALNTVATGIAHASAGIGGQSAARYTIGPGDEIVVTATEHHANLVPWQQLAAITGATLTWIPIDGQGRLDLDNLDTVITERAKVVAFTHVSNVTGLVTPVEPIVARAKHVGAITVLDACQSVPHMPVDFHALGVDFAAFSGHKMLGPTGIGALYGRAEMLETLPPAVFGGGSVATVTMEQTTWLDAPQRFESGTQPVAQAVGMAAAVEYLESIGMEHVAHHERELGAIMRAGAAELEGVRLLGPVDGGDRDLIGIAAVAVEGVHTHDVGQVLDDRGIAVRVGHHCNHPLHKHFGLTGSTRASTHVYNTEDDARAFVEALATVRPFFGVS